MYLTWRNRHMAHTDTDCASALLQQQATIDKLRVSAYFNCPTLNVNPLTVNLLTTRKNGERVFLQRKLRVLIPTLCCALVLQP